MKKFLSVCIAVCVLLGTFCLAASAARTGDVDYNNTVDAADARHLLRASVKLETFDSTKTVIGDIDFDGKITASDARLALRCSVNLEHAPDKAYTNEYEALRDGHFSANISVTSDGVDETMTVALIPDTVYMSADLGGMSINMLMNAESNYILLADQKMYMDISDSAFKSLGLDVNELKSEYGGMKSLSEAVNVSSGTLNGINCTVYTLDYGTYRTDVYMNGKKLVGEISYSGDYKDVTVYENFSVYVPSSYTALPAGYVRAPFDFF